MGLPDVQTSQEGGLGKFEWTVLFFYCCWLLHKQKVSSWRLQVHILGLLELTEVWIFLLVLSQWCTLTSYSKPMILCKLPVLCLQLPLALSLPSRVFRREHNFHLFSVFLLIQHWCGKRPGQYCMLMSQAPQATLLGNIDMVTKQLHL